MDSRSKYANLPFVAIGEKDVFETDEMPEVDQSMTTRGEPIFDASIDVISCGTLEAFKRFNDATKSELQFQRDTNESVLEKYNRLIDEIKELTDCASKDTNDSSKELLTKVDKLSEQLNDLQILRFDNTSTLKEVFESVDKSSTDKSETTKSDDNSKGDGQLSYKLMIRSEKSSLSESSRVNALEQRIKRIETLLGSNDNKLSLLNNYLKDRNLSDAVQELSAKVSQFDQNSLERVDSRLHMITDKLSQIAERKQQFEDLEKNSKINELFDMIEKTEKSRATLPTVLQRLESLNELQEQALQFSSALSYLDSLQTQVVDSMKTNENELKVLKESLEKNVESVKQILFDFDKRLKALN
ncbi:dynactin subunit 2-like isoform X1 [Oppia nitens]|uniref:dynactin subunit 2-like isoform X1 n=1 Tax=Oppia nitens TaxID=1686743 RepID=UPI0023DC8530|nr:dynactin subunit 2-like isoform X1 [Oppia nitens]